MEREQLRTSGHSTHQLRQTPARRRPADGSPQPEVGHSHDPCIRRTPRSSLRARMVPRRGLEPPRPCERQHLKLVRLPIPPPGHGCDRSVGRRRRLKAARAALSIAERRALVRHAMIERAEELGHRVRRRRLHRPLCLRRSCCKAGVRVRVAQRDPRSAYFIQPLARSASSASSAPTSPSRTSVARRGRGRDAVDQPGRRPSAGRCAAVHVDGARNVAEAAARAGRAALVHVSRDRRRPRRRSPLTAAPRAKARPRSRGAFPSATIIRPSLVFGPEDDLTNRFAGMARLPVLPVIAANDKFQPVYVRDLGKAIADGRARSAGARRQDLRDRRAAGDDHASSSTARSSRSTGQTPDLVDAARFRRQRCCRGFGFLPGAPLTRDQWLMLQRDNVAARQARPGSRRSGSSRRRSAAVADEWLGRFRRAARFAGRRTSDRRRG